MTDANEGPSIRECFYWIYAAVGVVLIVGAFYLFPVLGKQSIIGWPIGCGVGLMASIRLVRLSRWKIPAWVCLVGYSVATVLLLLVALTGYGD